MCKHSERIMRTHRIIRLISVVGAFAVIAMASEALATAPKTGGCPGAVTIAADNILINRPPLYSFCNPSA